MQIKVYSIDVQLPAWLKRAFIFGVVPALIVLGSAHYLRADVAVPNSFSDGDTLSAQKINDNFASVAAGINALGATVTTLQSTVAANATPAGSVVAFAGSVPPAGWLLCDGTAVSRTQYPALFAAISVTYGIGDAVTTFNLPDYRGRFLRGVDHGAKIDPDATSRKAAGGGAVAGADVVGTVQSSAFSSHRHSVLASVGNSDCQLDSAGCTGVAGWSNGVANLTYGPTNKAYIGMEGTSTESRPTNIAVDFIIKY